MYYVCVRYLDTRGIPTIHRRCPDMFRRKEQLPQQREPLPEFRLPRDSIANQGRALRERIAEVRSISDLKYWR